MDGEAGRWVLANTDDSNLSGKTFIVKSRIKGSAFSEASLTPTIRILLLEGLSQPSRFLGSENFSKSTKPEELLV